MQRLLRRIDRIRDTFWFVPALFTAGALVLSIITTLLDDRLELDGLGSPPLGFTGGADGARSFLSTVAGSIITVAGVAFSITIAMLATTSGQFGPRLIRNFIRDTSNQVVLGTFLATFAYAISTLRTVRGPGDEFVPYFSIAVCSLFTLASLAMLTFFIAHVSHSLQVMNIVAVVGKQLDATIARLYPEEKQSAIRTRFKDAAQEDEIFGRDFQSIPAPRSGYVLWIAHDRLFDLAVRNDLRLRVPHHAGQFVVQNATVVEARGPDGAEVDEVLVRELCSCFEIKDDRVADQDIEYHIDQLVEIAVRALSPGINDPYTALACMDRLGSSLRALAGRELPSGLYHDESGTLRMAANSQSFEGALDAAFNLMRQYGHQSVPVALRLLETLAMIADFVTDEAELQCLRLHARMIEESARATMSQPADLAALQERASLVTRAMQSGRGR